MSQNNMELARNGSKVWLNYWDSENGHDLVFELHPEGNITMSRDVNSPDFQEEEIEIHRVDFVHKLRELAFKIR